MLRIRVVCICSVFMSAAGYLSAQTDTLPKKDTVAVDTVIVQMPDSCANSLCIIDGADGPSAVFTTIKEPVDGPCLDFGKQTELDFEQIKESGGKVKKEMTFKNSGNKPLVVTKVVVSCKCVSIDYPKKPVMPGDEAKISVTYDPKKQKGVFHKAVQVYSNDPQARHIVFVKGEVVQ